MSVGKECEIPLRQTQKFCPENCFRCGLHPHSCLHTEHMNKMWLRALAIFIRLDDRETSMMIEHMKLHLDFIIETVSTLDGLLTLL